MCFEPTPREYFTPEQAPPRVTNLRTKLHDFAAAGVDAAIIQRFGPPFCTLGGVEFIEQIAHERLGARAIVVGDDFSSGARRRGDMVLLRGQATQFGFALDTVCRLRPGHPGCMSTAHREALPLLFSCYPDA